MNEETAGSERRSGDAPSATMAAFAPAMSGELMLVERPPPGQVKVIDVVQAKGLTFAFDLGDVQVAILDVDAVLTFPDGARIILPTLVLRMVSAEPPAIQFRELAIDPQTIIANAGDMRFFEQLPQLGASETARLENRGDAVQAPTAQAVQLPSAQQFANTPAPTWRAEAQQTVPTTNQVSEISSRINRRLVAIDDGSFRSEGALVDRSDRAGEAPKPPEAANAPPTITSGGGGNQANATIGENSSEVTRVRAVDPDPQPVFYTIVGGADAARFVINGLTGQLHFLSPPDFEQSTARFGPNLYEVIIAATDGRDEDRQAIYVTVSDRNEAPTGISLTATTVTENASTGTLIGRALGIDPDLGAVLRYSFAPGGNAGDRFSLDAVTGELRVQNGNLINFEASSTQLVIIRVTDQDGLFTDRAIILTVVDAADPPVIVSNGGGDSAVISSAENAFAVTVVTATDVDVNTILTYSIAGGTDAGLFTIDANSGVLRLANGANFENPQDSDGNNVYNVVVQVADQDGNVDQQSLAIIITDVNEAPTIVGTPSYSLSEDALNGTLVGIVQAVDEDAGSTIVFSLAPGGDAGGTFEIDAMTGALRLRDNSNLDYNTNPTYTVTVRVTDQLGAYTQQDVTIRVLDVNRSPVITSDGGGATASISVTEGTTLATTVTATDADIGTTLLYTIVGGADASRFAINILTGALTFVTPPDFEAPHDADGNNIFEVRVRVSDGILTDFQDLSIQVVDANDLPIITSNGGGSTATINLAENSTSVTTLSATDSDPGAVLTFTILGGADASRFTINALTGQLTFITPPNFEAPLDADADNRYEVIVGVLDERGGSDQQAITVNITNLNEAPIISSSGGGPTAAVSVTEGSTSALTLIASDPDGTSVTYSIVGGADASRFSINPFTGVITFNTTPDFEAPADVGADNVYDIVVQASDGTLVDTQAIAITITDANEAPVITSNGGGASFSISLGENVTAVTTVTATDVDAGATLTFSISGGADAALFAINATTGELTFIGPPDFESPADAGANNVYNLRVRTTDQGGLFDEQNLTVTITNVNEAPVITSNGGGAAASITVVEGVNAVTTVTAVDQDAGAVRVYSIIGGADAALFSINATTGVLSFVSTTNFETPVDADGNNIYEVVVQVSDVLGGTDVQTLSVAVINQNEAPVITSLGGGAIGVVALTENQTNVATVSATDADASSTITFTIAGGPDAALFAINAATGELTFIAPPDFEIPLDSNADNIYEVIVDASDGLLSDTQTIRVTISNINEAPVITSDGGGPTANINVAEGSTAVTTLTGLDPDAGTTLTYSIIGGADQALFTINSSTGVLTFISARDFETPTDVGGNNVYDVVVRLSDGVGGIDTQTIAVTVTNANEAPVITSNGGGATASISVNENATAVTTVTATDVDAGATRTFSISGGADAARFTINATTGVLTFVSGRNFESPTDAGADNIYDVIVRTTDQGGLFDEQAIAVQVLNVNEPPVITSNGGGATATINVAENTTAVTTVTATDPDAGSVRIYSISGGTDAARFSIDSSTGVLTLNTAANFEAPIDVGADNTYQVIVRVSDGLGGLDTQTITVNITNANEAPVITSNGGGATASISLAENTTTVTTVTATDVDAGATRTYSISGGADALRFTINGLTGELTFIGTPNFEVPTDAGLDNIYDVRVRTTDNGGLFDEQDIAVTITDANEAPVITSNGGGATASISISENTTAVTTVTATDVDAGATRTFSISGGTDAARFSIDSSTGVLTLNTAANFEAPIDVGADNTYEVIVRVSDGLGGLDTQTISVTITDANEAPVITSNGGGATASISISENTTAVTTVTATDIDAGATRTFSISGGADAALFAINAVTGELTFIAPPDFEAPGDAGGNNVYDVRIRTTDQGGLFDEQDIAVTITDANEAPVITSNGGGATASISISENTTAVTTVTATDIDAGATRTFSIVGGADAALFAINAVTGELTFIGTPNFEVPTDAGLDNIYDVRVRTTDNGGLFDEQDIAVTITDANEAPVITSNGGGATASISISENTTAVTTVTATDVDAGATRTFSIASSTDAALFAINATTGELTFIGAPDFEAPIDFGADNIYRVQVRVSDGLGGQADQTIFVNIQDVNEAPVITSNGGGATASISLAENTTTVTTVTATDVDAGATRTFSISGGADAALFAINAITGELTFIAPPDFETPGDAGGNNVYDVRVRTTDQGGLFDEQDIAVTITDANEAPVITSNGGGATASISISENTTTVTTVTATDVDAGATRTFSISGGADAALFAINAITGELTFIAPPDFETPGDAGGNNVYDVRVRTTDQGGLFDEQDIAVTITDANEAPVITSNGGGATASISISENTTAVTTVTATDPDAGATRTFSISGGADAALFAINAITGELTFIAPPDFETPGDAGGNNVYDVRVRTTDQGGLFDEQDIAVTITDANEAPVITSNGGGATASISISENTTAVTTVTATDPDAGATRTFSISGGADAALFAINAITGELTFIAPPDFETPGDAGGNNVYDVRVRTTDQGGLFDEQDIAVTITDANEAPVITSNGGGATASISLAENTTTVTTVTATDVDAGATRTFSISGGADAALFAINAITGELTFIAPPDFETPGDAGGNNVYDVRVRTTDQGGLFDEQDIAVTITDANEAPVITSNGGGVTASISISENTTAVTTVTATDPDAGATRTFSIVGGADAALFAINATTGELTFIAPPDFETPGDAGGNNVYDVRIRTTDQGGLFDEQDIAVTITDANEAPVITSNGGGATASISISENTTAVTTVTATDPDAGATRTFSISGGADAALFAINAITGELTFIAPPDFEAPGDAGGNNVYDVRVRTTDQGGLFDEQDIAVTITDANEAPVITSNGGGATASISISENTTAVTTVTATDPDAGATRTFSISGGADAALFAINAITGELTFIAPPDFEAPGDAGGNNVYDVRVRTTDQDGLFDEQDIAVTITDANEAPVITSHGGVPVHFRVVNEGVTAVTTITATDVDASSTITYSISGGLDATFFTVDAVTGVLSLVAPLNFEVPADSNLNNIYQVIIRASDGTLFAEQTVQVQVGDVNEAPVITSNGGGATASISISENTTAVTTVTATDPDAGATRTFSISGGADAALFAINAITGELTFIAPPDFEAPGDAGGNNVYDVRVRTTDQGGLFDEQDIAVTITNVTGPTLMGDAGNNTLSGTDEEESIFGLDGDDALTGLNGNDTLDGGNGHDTLTGGLGSDHLIGRSGNDTLIGGAGADILDGGADTDTASYADSSAQVVIDLHNGTGTGAGSTAQGDTLSSIESVIGSNHDDIFLASNDANAFDGGAGADTVSYIHSTGGVAIDFGTGLGSGSFAVGDSFVGVEQVIGSTQNDTFTLAANATAIGDAGDDAFLIDATVLLGGSAQIRGGTGSDTVSLTGTDTLDTSHLGVISQVETIDFEAAGVAATLSNFTASMATSILGTSGPGQTLTLNLDGNDTFSVAAGEHVTTAGGLYTFYSDAGLTNEIARVSVV